MTFKLLSKINFYQRSAATQNVPLRARRPHPPLLRHWVRRFVPHILRNDNQFSTPLKEYTYRHSLQSFALILLQRSFVSGIVRKRALNQNKNTNTIAYRNAGNCP